MAKPTHPQRPPIMATRHIVAAGHHMAAQAGFEILEAGGNAIDAGVAAELATCVLESERVGLACVAPIMIYLADRKEVVTVTGLGPWPKAASCDWFVKNHGGAIPRGLNCSVVPGSPDSWIVALEKFGTMTFAEVAKTAMRLASEGFPMYHHFSEVLHDDAKAFGRWPATAEIFQPGGKPPMPGDIFVQADLGRVMQYMADEEKAHSKKGRSAGLTAARDAFYKGDIAKTIDAYYRANGGWMTYDDLAAYHSDVEPPLSRRFHGNQIYTCGPWCQGPMLLEILAMLEGYDLKALGHNSADYVHTFAEVIKLASADREAYFGDPKFVDVPIETLLSKAYIDARRRMIRPNEAWPEMPSPGPVSGWKGKMPIPQPKEKQGTKAERANLNDTSYMCVVDRHGNAFSATPSDGSKRVPIVPGTGLSISSRGTQSWGNPDHTSSVQPGKRPRMTPNPVLAILDGGRVMPFGTPGGDVQTQTMAQVLLNITVFGMDPQTAVEAPRFASFSYPGSFEPHDYTPGLLRMEPGVGKEVGEILASRGHDVKWWPDRADAAGSACAIVQQENGSLIGGADHRRVAYAVGW